MKFTDEVNLLIKGSASTKTKTRPTTRVDVEKSLELIKTHPIVEEYDVYLCGGVVEGYYGSDIDFVVSGGEFDTRKIFCYLTEVTQMIIDEGIDVDIHYMPDMSWLDGVEGEYEILFAYNVYVLVVDGKLIKNRLYKNKRVGLLLRSIQHFPTPKSISRMYDLNRINKVRK